jgi:hypothetical protein
MRQIKQTPHQRGRGLDPEITLITSARVRRDRVNQRRLYNDVSDGLKGFKSTAAINIRALVIALFGFCTEITAGSGMCRILAHWTVHHLFTRL